MIGLIGEPGGLGDSTWHMHDELVVGTIISPITNDFFREWGIGLMFGVMCWKLLCRAWDYGICAIEVIGWVFDPL